MNKKKCLAVLSRAAMGVLIASAITASVSAKVTSYVVDNSGQVIRFNLDSLLTDYTNKLSGLPAPMFDEYMRHSSQLTAFEDDLKGLVSYDSVIKVYTDMLAQNKGNEFKIDTVTENASAGDIKNITVGYEWRDGAIVPIMPTATVEQAGTAIVGKTVVVVSLPLTIDPTKYDLTIDGKVLTYNSITQKFTITLDGNFTKEELQVKIAVTKKDVTSSIKSIANISATVNQNDKYTLPSTVTATMSDGSSKSINVSWDNSVVDTSTVGIFTFNGIVEGYGGSVRLMLNVKGLTNQIINFPDKNLEQAIRNTINKPTGDIYKSDVEKITNLNITMTGIKDITGIENLINLQEFYMQWTGINDINALKSLTNLQKLSIGGNGINDISVLKNLTKLDQLDLYTNKITDISVLENLTNLQELDLSDNQISDISKLKDLTNLQKLSLNSNQISDISVLKYLTNLQELNLATAEGMFALPSSNKITDISVLKYLTKLKTLYLGGMAISNIGILEGLTSLEHIELSCNKINDISILSRLTNLQIINLQYNQISNINALGGLTNLQQLALGGNTISDISALSGLVNLQKLSLWCNQISDISSLSGLTSLQELKLETNKISNISSLIKLTNLKTLYLYNNPITDYSPVKGYYNNLTDKDFELNLIGSDTTAPRVTGMYANLRSLSDGNDKVVVCFSEAMDTATLTNKNNYVFCNGEGDTNSLPTDATISVGTDAKSVIIEFPSSYNVRVNGDNANGMSNDVIKMTIANVKDQAGNVLDGIAYKGIISGNLAGAQVKANTIKVYYDGDDLKVDVQFDKVLDQISASDFTLGGVTPSSASLSGNKVTLTFRDGVAETGKTVTYTNGKVNNNPNKIDVIKSQGQNARLAIKTNNTTTDETGASVLALSDTTANYQNTIYDYQVAPKTAFDYTDSNGNKQTLWTAVSNGITSEIDLTFDTILDANSGVKTDDFTFINGGTDVKADVVTIDGNTIKFTFNKALSGQLDIRAKSTVSLRTIKDADGNNACYVPSSDDLEKRTINVTNSVVTNSNNIIVTFPDKNLEKVIRDVINKPTGDIYKSDVQKITELNISSKGIKDISGIENLTNLQSLYGGITYTTDLNRNQISDINALKGLTNLKNINLNNNQISDISSLEGLTNLEDINLNSNQISDISALKSLTNLKNLWVDSNQISDISSLKELVNLQFVYLANNQISDISSLKALTNLPNLYLHNNRISDIYALKDLTNLQTLGLSGNQISDISALKGLTNLTELNLHYNQISNISVLSGLINLQRLLLNNNQISDIGALGGLTSLKTLWLSNNQITDYSPVKGYYNNLTNKDFTLSDSTNVVVTFKDKNLEQVIRQQINKPTGDIYKSDIEYVISLDASDKGIQDISGIENLTHLMSLYVSKNQIYDITPLSSLKNLTQLYLDENQVSDISPLKNLTSLTDLRLGKNQIEDISCLKNLTNLYSLGLDSNQISNIDALGDLTGLENLELLNNQINDISQLKGLCNLQTLFLNNNQISDINVLESLSNLNNLYLSGNQIKDITVLKSLVNLRDLILYNNQISDISALKGLTNLNRLDISSNEISNISALQGLTNLYALFLKNNEIKDFSPVNSYYKNLKIKDF